jgi:methylase of polypeptide subunit release factors
MDIITLPDDPDAARLREFFSESGYSEDGLTETLGRSSPPEEGRLQGLLHLTREASAGNALARLFLIGTDIEQDIADTVLPEWFLQLCLATGLLEQSADEYRATVVIVPVGDFLIASDAFRMLGSRNAGEFVLPASTHSANFLRCLMITTKVERVLDLGCGCGIHALFASMYGEQVIASDISERAVRFAEFNAVLNGRGNISCVTGDRFAAIGEQKFDQVISNPPFVLGPDDEFTYRDNELELDRFCLQLVREAADHLNDGGYLQMLFESVEFDGESWQDRMGDWVRNTGCDTWLLHSPPVRPAEYTAARLSDIRGGPAADSDTHQKWFSYFSERNVTGIHPGMMVLRRRDGANWLHIHNLSSDLDGNAGDAVLRGIAANDFLEKNRDDQALLDSTLMLSPYLRLEQEYGRAQGQWQPTKAVLSMTDGMLMEAEVDMPVIAFLNQLDGRRSLRDCVAHFAQAAQSNEKKISADFLPIIRMFVARGFAVPA